MQTSYKEMGSFVMQALENDPETGNGVPRKNLTSALVAMVVDDVPGGYQTDEPEEDEFPETGYEREGEVKTAMLEYLQSRSENEDPCLTVEDYVLLVDYVQNKVWPK